MRDEADSHDDELDEHRTLDGGNGPDALDQEASNGASPPGDSPPGGGRRASAEEVRGDNDARALDSRELSDLDEMVTLDPVPSAGSTGTHGGEATLDTLSPEELKAFDRPSSEGGVGERSSTRSAGPAEGALPNEAGQGREPGSGPFEALEPQPPSVGDDFEVADGRYVIDSMLGEGGMGRVFKAFDRKLQNRVVALKRISRDDPVAIQRFYNEAGALARLRSHPNICQVYDRGRDEKGDYLVMEYIAGHTLLGRVRSDGVVQGRELLRLAESLARALKFAHRFGIIHRDVKPSNVMFSVEGEPKLCDFGLARDPAQELDEPLTQDGLGTMHFAAPEQLQPGGHVDRRADIYGLGATLYFAITGQPPRGGMTAAIPADWRSLLSRCLEPNPDLRVPSAEAFLDELEQVRSLHTGTGTSHESSAQPQVCGGCSKINPADSEHCVHCGVRLQEKCPNCGSRQRLDRVHCSNCGFGIADWIQEKQLLEQARELADRGRVSEALECINRGIDGKPESAARRSARLQLEITKGRIDHALSRSRELRSEGFLKQAQLELEKARKRSPNHDGLLEELARIESLLEAERFEASKAVFEGALKSNDYIQASELISVIGEEHGRAASNWCAQAHNRIERERQSFLKWNLADFEAAVAKGDELAFSGIVADLKLAGIESSVLTQLQARVSLRRRLGEAFELLDSGEYFRAEELVYQLQPQTESDRESIAEFHERFQEARNAERATLEAEFEDSLQRRRFRAAGALYVEWTQLGGDAERGRELSEALGSARRRQRVRKRWIQLTSMGVILAVSVFLGRALLEQVAVKQLQEKVADLERGSRQASSAVSRGPVSWPIWGEPWAASALPEVQRLRAFDARLRRIEELSALDPERWSGASEHALDRGREVLNGWLVAELLAESHGETWKGPAKKDLERVIGASSPLSTAQIQELLTVPAVARAWGPEHERQVMGWLLQAELGRQTFGGDRTRWEELRAEATLAVEPFLRDWLRGVHFGRLTESTQHMASQADWQRAFPMLAQFAPESLGSLIRGVQRRQFASSLAPGVALGTTLDEDLVEDSTLWRATLGLLWDAPEVEAAGSILSPLGQLDLVESVQADVDAWLALIDRAQEFRAVEHGTLESYCVAYLSVESAVGQVAKGEASGFTAEPTWLANLLIEAQPSFSDRVRARWDDRTLEFDDSGVLSLPSLAPTVEYSAAFPWRVVQRNGGWNLETQSRGWPTETEGVEQRADGALEIPIEASCGRLSEGLTVLAYSRRPKDFRSEPVWVVADGQAGLEIEAALADTRGYFQSVEARLPWDSEWRELERDAVEAKWVFERVVPWEELLEHPSLGAVKLRARRGERADEQREWSASLFEAEANPALPQMDRLLDSLVATTARGSRDDRPLNPEKLGERGLGMLESRLEELYGNAVAGALDDRDASPRDVLISVISRLELFQARLAWAGVDAELSGTAFELRELLERSSELLQLLSFLEAVQDQSLDSVAKAVNPEAYSVWQEEQVLASLRVNEGTISQRFERHARRLVTAAGAADALDARSWRDQTERFDAYPDWSRCLQSLPASLQSRVIWPRSDFHILLHEDTGLPIQLDLRLERVRNHPLRLVLVPGASDCPAFYIAESEIDTVQWERVMNDAIDPRQVGLGVFLYSPQAGIDWVEADRWCRFQGLQLPTQRQWDRLLEAARLLDGEPDQGRAVGWLADRSVHGPQSTNRSANSAEGSATVHGWSSMRNQRVVRDVLGNLSEWCRDPYVPDGSSGVDLPPYRIVLGSNWRRDVTADGPGFRSFWFEEGRAIPLIGFRPVLELVE